MNRASEHSRTLAATRRRERGLTLIEISVSMVVMALTAFGVAASMMTGVAASRRYQQNTIVIARAQHYLETLYNLQFGTAADAAATTTALELVFSGNPDLGSNPPTLVSLAKKIDTLTNSVYSFTPSSFGFAGQYIVRVSNNVAQNMTFLATVDSDHDGIPDTDGYTAADASPVKQDPNRGCYEAITSDDSRELFCFEIWFQPATPTNAPQQLVFRGYRSQDP